MQKVLLDLDMQAIKDNQARKLSGGQKRKLSVGIAVLGDPKVSGYSVIDEIILNYVELKSGCRKIHIHTLYKC